jgi:hypothetical protein
MCLVASVLFSQCHHPSHYRLVDACHAGFLYALTTPPRTQPHTTSPPTTTPINSCILNQNIPVPTPLLTRRPYCAACIAVEEDKILFRYEQEIQVTVKSLMETTLEAEEMYGVGFVSVRRLEGKMGRELEGWWVEAGVAVGGRRRWEGRVGKRGKLVRVYGEVLSGWCD